MIAAQAALASGQTSQEEIAAFIAANDIDLSGD